MLAIYVLTFVNDDQALVLKKGRKLEVVVTSEASFSDPDVTVIARNLAAFFGVRVKHLNVPSHVLDAEEWTFDDGVAWLKEKLKKKTARRR